MKAIKKRKLYLIIATLFVTSVAFRLITGLHFGHTSLLFVGLPTVLAVTLVAASKTTKTMMGLMLKVVTLFLLLSGILLGEGLACIIMAAPIFYGVGAVVVWLYNHRKYSNRSHFFSLSLLPMLVLGLQIPRINEAPQWRTIETIQTISTTNNIEVLGHPQSLPEELPLFFQLGFPKPIDWKIDGVSVGDSSAIVFDSSTKGLGTMLLKVVERTENSVLYTFISDNTHMSHWLTFKTVKVSINTLENGQKQIQWQTTYACSLGPQWYFEPIEDFAVGLMQAHLIQHFFI